jgi:hypothetical protein
MKSKKVLMIALLAFSFLAPLQLSSTASAESSDVLAKGQLVRPASGGTPRQTYCPPAMAAAGITINTNLSSAGLLIDFRIECITQSMLEKGLSTYASYTKFYGRDASSDLPTRTFFCPGGSVLTGLRMSTSSFIRDMAPVCGNPETGETTLDSKVGSSAGEALPSASICPAVSGKPTYVVGLDGFSGGGVDAVQVLCGRTLKSNSKIEFSSEPVLLAQYLPKGVLSTNHYLQATSVNPFVNFSSLNQIAGDGTANTDVFPFKTSTVGVVDGTHYFYFTMTPSSPNVIIKVTQVTYSSLSYAIGLGTGDKKITGNAANRMFIWPTNASTFASIPISPTNDARQFSFSRQDLSVIPSVKSGTEFKVGFAGATGYQYNDLSGRNGGTGMMIYGQLIDNSPVVPEAPAVTKAPDAPTNFTFNLAKNTVVISVDVPKSLIGSVDRNNFALISPELGFSGSNKLIPGLVDKGKAYFKFKLEDVNLGKEVTFRIATLKDSIESAPLLKTIKLPKLVAPTPTPKATATPKSTPKAKPKVTPTRATTIKCSKAGVTRVFTATSCPPGYTKQ